MDNMRHLVDVVDLAWLATILLHFVQHGLWADIFSPLAFNRVRLYLNHQPLEQSIGHAFALSGRIVSKEFFGVHWFYVTLNINCNFENNPQQLLGALQWFVKIRFGLFFCEEGFGDTWEHHDCFFGEIDFFL